MTRNGCTGSNPVRGTDNLVVVADATRKTNPAATGGNKVSKLITALPEEKELDYYSPRIEIRLTLPSLTIIITNINMSQIKIYHIIKTIAKTSVMSGDYKSCLNYFKEQDKVFRKTHKIISAEDYQKILKKKPM